MKGTKCRRDEFRFSNKKLIGKFKLGQFTKFGIFLYQNQTFNNLIGNNKTNV